MVHEHLCVSKKINSISFSIAVIERTILKLICFDSAGSNGMGQAQSQSSGTGCDDCYGSDTGYTHGKLNFKLIFFQKLNFVEFVFLSQDLAIARMRYEVQVDHLLVYHKVNLLQVYRMIHLEDQLLLQQILVSILALILVLIIKVSNYYAFFFNCILSTFHRAFRLWSSK